jgi:hypothetical protein
LENYFLSGDLEAQIDAFVTDYNHRSYHESISNSPRLTSTSDVGPPSWQSEKGSNDRRLLTADCSTSYRPPEITNPMRQSLPYLP